MLRSISELTNSIFLYHAKRSVPANNVISVVVFGETDHTTDKLNMLNDVVNSVKSAVLVFSALILLSTKELMTKTRAPARKPNALYNDVKTVNAINSVETIGQRG